MSQPIAVFPVHKKFLGVKNVITKGIVSSAWTIFSTQQMPLAIIVKTSLTTVLFAAMNLVQVLPMLLRLSSISFVGSARGGISLMRMEPVYCVRKAVWLAIAMTHALCVFQNYISIMVLVNLVARFVLPATKAMSVLSVFQDLFRFLECVSLVTTLAPPAKERILSAKLVL